jgi:hypothetical protein
MSHRHGDESGDPTQIQRFAGEGEGALLLVLHPTHVVEAQVGDDDEVNALQVHPESLHIAQQWGRVLPTFVET